MEHMLRPVEWKAVGDGTGELEGYASVFGNLDLGGDVVMPGAFRKTLADWARAKQPLPLIADHMLSTEGVIGSVLDAREDSVGLYVKARFSSVPKAQEIRTKMLEGHISGMSFTYEIVKSYAGKLAGKTARFLQELRLFEATVTPFPMNELAIASAKTATTTTTTTGGAVTVQINPEVIRLDWETSRNAFSAALAIPVPAAAKAAFDVLVRDYVPGEADTAAVEPDEADTAHAADDTSTDEAAVTVNDPESYGARLLGLGTTAPLEPPDVALGIQRTIDQEEANRELDALEARIVASLGRTDT